MKKHFQAYDKVYYLQQKIFCPTNTLVVLYSLNCRLFGFGKTDTFILERPLF